MTDPRFIMRRAKLAGDRRVQEVAAMVDANEPEIASMTRLGDLVRHGYKAIDIAVRKDGREYSFQGDWLARLFRGPASADRSGEAGETPLGGSTVGESAARSEAKGDAQP